jgi:hypothetical protein
LFAQLVKPGIKKLVNEMFSGVQYVLTQQEYDEFVSEEVVTRRFAHGWDALILPFKVRREGTSLITGRSHANQLPESFEFVSQIPGGSPREKNVVFSS